LFHAMNRFGLVSVLSIGAAACNASHLSVRDSGVDSGAWNADAGSMPTGDGGFQLVPGTPTSLPVAPTLLQVADFNQDGKLDALVLYGQKGGHQAQVFLGNGDGTFDPGAMLETGQLPMGLALADFNGDGALDAAIGDCAQNGSDAGLLIFAGDGQGNFGMPSNTGLAFCPFSLAVADLNGDGFPDLVTAGPGPGASTPTTGEVRVYLGGPTGLTYLEAFPFAVQVLAVTAADFNQDGKVDLAVSLANNQVEVLYGDGQGDFAGFAPVTVAETAYRLIHAPDLDGDGRPDLLLTDIRGWMALFTSESQGGAASLSPPDYFLAGNELTAVAFADLGGDGHLDIAAANASANYTGVTLMVAQADGGYAYQGLFTQGPAFGIAAGDFDGDGRTDLAFTNQNAQTLEVLFNRAPSPPVDAGVFVPGKHTPIPPVPDQGGPVVASPQLFTITFDDDAQRENDEPYADWIVGSDWLTTVAGEYGVSLGTNQDIHLPGPAPTATSDVGIQKLLAELILDGGLPPPIAYDGGATNQIYMIYFPLQTTITSAGALGTSCQNYGGYHSESALGSTHFIYAVIPTCGYTGDLTQTETTVSHELLEASTDPFPYSNPTYTSGNMRLTNGWVGELADLCEYYAVAENDNYVAQRIWSNKAAAAGTQPCVPSFGEPYANASPSPDGVITLEPGQKIEITLSGWTDVPTPPFAINAENYGPTLLPATFNPAFSLSTDTLQNGQTATLTISVPVGTASGAIGEVVVYGGLSDDNFGYWPLLVGVP